MLSIATEDPDGQCKLLGPFSLLIQLLLGLLSLSSLIYKRYKEYPKRRPWKIWFFDVSKQVFGAIGIHFLNLGLSVLGSSSSTSNDNLSNVFDQKYQYVNFMKLQNNENDDNNDDISNPCNWYFLNILFDTTIGVPILWCFLYIIFGTAKKLGIKGISSGQYGVPPSYSFYLKQLILYFLGLFTMKLVVYMLLISVSIFETLADLLLSVFDPLPRLQIFMVTFVTPLVMNSLQYILIDNIIQSPEYKGFKSVQISCDLEDSDTLVDDENDGYIRGSLPNEGLLGQPEPQEFEGQSLKNSLD